MAMQYYYVERAPDYHMDAHAQFECVNLCRRLIQNINFKFYDEAAFNAQVIANIMRDAIVTGDKPRTTGLKLRTAIDATSILDVLFHFDKEQMALEVKSFDADTVFPQQDTHVDQFADSTVRYATVLNSDKTTLVGRYVGLARRRGDDRFVLRSQNIHLIPIKQGQLISPQVRPHCAPELSMADWRGRCLLILDVEGLPDLIQLRPESQYPGLIL